jgi:hypothetical protein
MCVACLNPFSRKKAMKRKRKREEKERERRNDKNNYT